jgi:hypothetical protein
MNATPTWPNNTGLSARSPAEPKQKQDRLDVIFTKISIMDTYLDRIKKQFWNKSYYMT